jgi:glycosyltransferase involved in cell wall biosynthesis
LEISIRTRTWLEPSSRFAQARREVPALGAHQLVIAGARWWGSGLEEHAARAAPPGSVLFLGRVPDHDRDALLQRAVALVYVSLFEGIGLPPVEAMAAGTPVLASNVTSLPEVLGAAALLVNPHDVDTIAHGLVALSTDPALRWQLHARGLAGPLTSRRAHPRKPHWRPFAGQYGRHYSPGLRHSDLRDDAASARPVRMARPCEFEPSA